VEVPNFRNRLTGGQRRVYDRSDAVSSITLRATPRLRGGVTALAACLPSADRRRVEQVSQAIADELTAALAVPPVRVQVSGRRPADARGELHGLYTPANGRGTATIKVWMITVKRAQVVAFKTFLRTLLHEICHHLDYALLRLPYSFHTTGFYKRESSLFHQIGGATASAGAGFRVPGVGLPKPDTRSLTPDT
jgi:hypothetical protein